MDKTRTLPPLVRGRVTRILEFFVDKIKFFRNILVLTDNFDLVLQLQWWGETLPAHIRPKELQMEDQIFKNFQSHRCYYKEKYEIKTTLELFHSYLKTCEVLELSVLEAVENYIIGSAFIRNLIYLLKNNNELISVPIFDYLGEEIGEVVIHVNFFEKLDQKIELKLNESPQLCNDYYFDKKLKKDCDMFRNSEDNYLSLGEKTLFYDSHSTERNYENQYLNEKLQAQNNQVDILKSESKNLNLPWISHSTKPLLNQEGSVIVTKSCSNESLPNIKILSDSSKVLYFGLNSQKPRPKSDIRNNKIKVCNKFSSNSIKCKSKSKSLADQKPKERKEVMKTTDFPKKQANLKKEKQLDFKVSLSHNFEEPEVIPHDKQSLSSKGNSHTKVLDYLLGCDMSKDNEESALNDFKKMSPCHSLVDSISQLCFVCDNNSLPHGINTDSKLPISSKQPPLNFDFNNPIEKTYYERFFLNANSCAGLEVAEFLNHTENSFKLKKSEFYEAEPQKKSQKNSKSCSEFLFAEDNKKYSLSDDFKICDRAKNCGRCKYYKKLCELDMIIESLKHFEQKMIVHEKNSQNPDVLNKRNHFAKGS